MESGNSISERFRITHEGNMIMHGASMSFGNTANAAFQVEATAHNVAGKDLTISAGDTTAGTTDNIAGGDLNFQAGQGKGSGAGGNIVFQVANAGGSGSSLNSLATAMTISDDKSVKLEGTFACNGQTPAARPDYTVSNGLVDRAFDANSTSTAELADVLGTVISDLISVGIFQ